MHYQLLVTLSNSTPQHTSFAIRANILQHSIPYKHEPKILIAIHNGLPYIDFTLGALDGSSTIILAIL